jgi:hypothetical protein
MHYGNRMARYDVGQGLKGTLRCERETKIQNLPDWLEYDGTLTIDKHASGALL